MTNNQQFREYFNLFLAFGTGLELYYTKQDNHDKFTRDKKLKRLTGKLER